jgi:hypothetical protein
MGIRKAHYSIIEGYFKPVNLNPDSRMQAICLVASWTLHHTETG